MSQTIKEIALLKDLISLPPDMQKVYLQLVSTIDCSLQKFGELGAHPDYISEEFIQNLTTRLLDQELAQDDLESCIEEELQRQILERATFATVC
jgi:hypothetical protein